MIKGVMYPSTQITWGNGILCKQLSRNLAPIIYRFDWITIMEPLILYVWHSSRHAHSGISQKVCRIMSNPHDIKQNLIDSLKTIKVYQFVYINVSFSAHINIVFVNKRFGQFLLSWCLWSTSNDTKTFSRLKTKDDYKNTTHTALAK